MEKQVDDTPFPLAYLDWCKSNGCKTIEETQNRDLIRKFYKEEWEPSGKSANGFDYAIAMGVEI